MHNLKTFKHNTLINKLLLMQLYLINIRPTLHHQKSHCLVNMSAVPNFLDFTTNAVLRPTFIRKLCYKLPSIVTFTFIQFFLSKLCLLYWMASKLPRLLDRPTASKFVLFLVSGLKDKKLIKKQIYMKTEACKLYCRGFWIFLPNFIKIDPYNF